MVTLLSSWKRSSAALISGAMLLQPLSAFAAFDTPAELLKAVASDTHAYYANFSMNMHMGEGLTVRMHMQGQTQMGKGTNAQDATSVLMGTKQVLNAAADIDVDGKTSNVAFELRIADGNAYLLAKKMDANTQEELAKMGLHLDTKTWLKIPLSQQHASDASQAFTQLLSAGLALQAQTDWNNMFAMEQEKYANGTAYSLTIRPEARNQAGTTVTAHTKINMNRADELLFLKTYTRAQSLFADITVEGRLDRKDGSVQVDIPTNVITVPTNANVSSVSRTTRTRTLATQAAVSAKNRAVENRIIKPTQRVTNATLPANIRLPSCATTEEGCSTSRAIRALKFRTPTTDNHDNLRTTLFQHPTGVETTRISRRSIVQQYRGETEARAVVTSARMKLKAGNPLSLGSQNATVTVALFSDYDCAACGEFWKHIFKPFKKDYVDTGKVHFVFRNYPVNTVSHPYSQVAAEAVECMRDAGDAKALLLQDTLFDAARNKEKLTTMKITEWSKKIGADVRQCLKDHTKATIIQRDIDLGKLYEVPQVPAVVITNRDGAIAFRLVDIYDYEWFTHFLDEAMQ